MIKNLFPIPFGEYDLSSYPNKTLLLSLLKNSPTTSHKAVTTGTSSFHSPGNILNNSSLVDLKYNIQKCIDDYCFQVGIKKCYITNSWFNILKKGGKTQKHHHGISVISGAYYPLLEKDSCDLQFHFPNSQFLMNWDPSKITIYNNPKTTISIKQDFLYLFPSGLEHSTKINQSENRIVVSFNTIHKNSEY